MNPKTQQEHKMVERALTEIGSIALNGISKNCPGCGRKQGYVFFASDVRTVLYRLLRKKL